MGETVGSLTPITFDFALDGELSASGLGQAAASWQVAIGNEFLANDSISLIDAGTQAFSVSESLEVFVPIGGSFDITFMIDLEVSGAGDSFASAELFDLNLGMATMSVPPIPAPGAALLAIVGLSAVGWMRRHF